jgi:hypothetical protein
MQIVMKKIALFLALAIIFCFCSFGQKVGDKVKVLRKGKYIPATVKQVKGAKWYVHFDGYKSSCDEWVGKDRIKVIPKTDNTKNIGKTEVKTDANKVTTPPKKELEWKVGEKIMVMRNYSWYPATIQQINNGFYFIHYDSNPSTKNDEWVGPARMKKNTDVIKK